MMWTSTADPSPLPGLIHHPHPLSLSPAFFHPTSSLHPMLDLPDPVSAPASAEKCSDLPLSMPAGCAMAKCIFVHILADSMFHHCVSLLGLGYNLQVVYYGLKNSYFALWRPTGFNFLCSMCT